MLLRLSTMIQYIMGAHAVYAIAETADATATQLFVHYCLVSEIAADPAVLCRHIKAEETQLPHLLPNLAADVMLRTPECILRDHFGLNESGHGVAKCRELVVHPIGDVSHQEPRFTVRGELGGISERHIPSHRKCGMRRSKNAAMPSWKSAVRVQAWKLVRSASNC